MHTAEPLVPECSCLKIETAIEKLKICKSPSVDHVCAELIQMGDNTLQS
jgi:hypothetical protein